jgi:hypothetical protein
VALSYVLSLVIIRGTPCMGLLVPFVHVLLFEFIYYESCCLVFLSIFMVFPPDKEGGVIRKWSRAGAVYCTAWTCNLVLRVLLIACHHQGSGDEVLVHAEH